MILQGEVRIEGDFMTGRCVIPCTGRHELLESTVVWQIVFKTRKGLVT